MADLFVRIGADLTAFSTSMQNMERQLMKSGRKMQAMGRNMSQVFTLPLAAIAGLSVRSFAKFDSAMTQSLAIMSGITPKIRKQMEDVAKTASQDLGMSLDESAKSYFFLASAGLDAAQSMEALPIVAKFAKAGMFDMALATDLATDAQSALGLTVKDTKKNTENLIVVTDTLVKANTLANATVEQFSAALTNKAGAAIKSVGKSIQEGTAVLAAFADQGIKGAEAGTQLHIVMRDLQTKAIENEGAFKKAGVSVFNASGEMNNMGDIVGDLENHLEGMSDKQKKSSLMMLGFTDKSIGAMMALMGTSEKIKTYQQELENATGFTDKVAGKQMLSFSEQVNKLKAELGVLATDIAPVVIDGFIKPLMKGIKNLGAWFGNLSDNQKNTIIKFAGIVAAIGPVIFIIGKFKSAIAGLISLNPILLVIGVALGAVVAAVMQFNDEQKRSTVNTSEFVKAVQTERNELDSLFNSLKDTNTSYADRTKAIKTINDKYGEYFPNLLTEKSSLKEIENAQNMVTLAIIKKVALMSREKEITEASTKALDENRKAADKITKLITKSKGASAAGGASQEIQELIKLNAALNTQIAKTGITSAQTKAAGEKLTSAQNAFAKKYGLEVSKFNRIVGTAGAAVKERQQSIKGIDDYFKGFIGSLETGTKAVKQFSQAELDMVEKEIKYLSELKKTDANQDKQLREALSKRQTLLALKKEQVKVDGHITELTKEQIEQIDAYNKKFSTTLDYTEALTDEQIKALKGLTDGVKESSTALERMYAMIMATRQELNKPLIGADGGLIAEEGTTIDVSTGQMTEVKAGAQLESRKQIPILPELPETISEMEQLQNKIDSVVGRMQDMEIAGTAVGETYTKLQEILKSLQREQTWANDLENALEQIRQAIEDTAEQMVIGVAKMSGAFASGNLKEKQAELNDELKQQKEILSDSSATEEAKKQAQERIESINKEINALKPLNQVRGFILGALADLAIRVGEIAVGIAIAVKGIKEALKSLNPVLALAAGIALIALGSFAKSKLASAAPALAEGGIATGPTLAMVGDNPRASVDPEVISPLSKLKGLIGGGNQVFIPNLQIAGSDLLIVFDRAKRAKSKIY